MQFVSDVLKSVNDRGMTGMLCLKITDAKYLLNIFFRDGLPYSISFGRLKNEQALGALMQGGIESYHFVPNLTTQHQGVLSSENLIRVTAPLQVAAGRLVDSGTASSGNSDQEHDQVFEPPLLSDDVTPESQVPVRHKAPTLPADIPWE